MKTSPALRATEALPMQAHARQSEAGAATPPPAEGGHPREPARLALRAATAAAHRALDQHPLMQRLTRSDLTREQYTESLAAMYPAHASLERLVHESRHHVQSGFVLPARTQGLEADLLELGRPLPSIPHFPADPPEDRASWWGRVYVLEGSRLGSVFISRKLRSSLGDSVPRRFFGEPAMPEGQAVLSAMREQALEDPGQLEQAIASALAAFAAYRAVLDVPDPFFGAPPARKQA